MYMTGISAERRFTDKMCTGNILSGKRPACTGNVRRETSCPGIVQSGKHPVRETSVYRQQDYVSIVVRVEYIRISKVYINYPVKGCKPTVGLFRMHLVQCVPTEMRGWQ